MCLLCIFIKHVKYFSTTSKTLHTKFILKFYSFCFKPKKKNLILNYKIIYSFNYFIQSHVQPLFLTDLTLTDFNMVFNPSIDAHAPNSFVSLVESLLKDIFEMSSLIERVSVSTDRVNYLVSILLG